MLQESIFNPLESDSPNAWDALIESIGPASLLVIIDSRLGERLRRVFTPEDVLQESLLHAWRDRAKCEWRGLKSFRSWLLTIIDHRIQRAAETANSLKRGGGSEPVVFSALDARSTGDSRESHFAGPVGSTTPSRVAMAREEAACIRSALDALPQDLRDVVWWRLFEQETVEGVANRLGIGVSAVRHRLRKGSEQYRRLLTAALESHSRTIVSEFARQNIENPSTQH